MPPQSTSKKPPTGPNAHLVAILQAKIDATRLARPDNTNLINVLSRALKAIKNHPERLSSGKDAQKNVKGVGPAVAKLIDDGLLLSPTDPSILAALPESEQPPQKLPSPQSLNIHPHTTLPGAPATLGNSNKPCVLTKRRRMRASKKECPHFDSPQYSLLVAMLRGRSTSVPVTLFTADALRSIVPAVKPDVLESVLSIFLACGLIDVTARSRQYCLSDEGLDLAIDSYEKARNSGYESRVIPGIECSAMVEPFVETQPDIVARMPSVDHLYPGEPEVDSFPSNYSRSLGSASIIPISSSCHQSSHPTECVNSSSKLQDFTSTDPTDQNLVVLISSDGDSPVLVDHNPLQNDDFHPINDHDWRVNVDHSPLQNDDFHQYSPFKPQLNFENDRFASPDAMDDCDWRRDSPFPKDSLPCPRQYSIFDTPQGCKKTDTVITLESSPLGPSPMHWAASRPRKSVTTSHFRTSTHSPSRTLKRAASQANPPISSVPISKSLSLPDKPILLSVPPSSHHNNVSPNLTHQLDGLDSGDATLDTGSHPQHAVIDPPAITPPLAWTTAPIITLPVGSFDIVILLDNREQSRRDRDFFQRRLENAGVFVDTVMLPVGDMVWAARPRPGAPIATAARGFGAQTYILLDYIAERKRIDDFASSIRDSRWVEQKWRLERSGLFNLHYIVEESFGHMGRILNDTAMQKAISTAKAQTMAWSGFNLHITKSDDDTADLLAQMTRTIFRLWAPHPLHVLTPAHVKSREDWMQYRRFGAVDAQRKELVPLPQDALNAVWYRQGAFQRCLGSPHILLASLNEFSGKSNQVRVCDIFMRMLMSIRGVSAEKARFLVQHFPTPLLLRKAYMNVGESERPLFLAKFCERVENEEGFLGRKRIMNALSQRIAEMFCSTTHYADSPTNQVPPPDI